MVDIFQFEILKKNIDKRYLGTIVDKSWKIKKNFSSRITNNHIDKLYVKVKKFGANGAKIIGAGAGGFLMVFANIKTQKKIIKNLNKNVLLKIKCEHEGSKVIYED